MTGFLIRLCLKGTAFGYNTLSFPQWKFNFYNLNPDKLLGDAGCGVCISHHEMCDGGKCKCSDGFIRHNNTCIGKVLTGFIVYCKKSFESDKYKSSMAEKSEAAVQRCF